MSLLLRPKSGPMAEVAYNPAKDITRLYPNILAAAEKFVMEERYAPLADYLRDAGITENDIGDTVVKLALMMNEAHKNPDDTIEDVMDRVGYSNTPVAARVALMYYVGTLCAGTFFEGIREMVRLGDETIPEVQRLMNTAERLEDYLSKNKVQRWWQRLKWKLFGHKVTYRIGK